jgi:hypothetical protein
MLSPRIAPAPHRSLLLCVSAALTALLCGALLTAAALVPAPAPVVPLLVAICIGCPMAAAWDLSDAVADVRARRWAARAARAHRGLRREIAALPECDHPLGL